MFLETVVFHHRFENTLGHNPKMQATKQSMKLFYNNEARKLDASELTFEALCSKTQEMFPDCAAAPCFTYVDSDDDRVTIANQADLTLAAATAGDRSLKVYVVDPVNVFDILPDSHLVPEKEKKKKGKETAAAALAVQKSPKKIIEKTSPHKSTFMLDELVGRQLGVNSSERRTALSRGQVHSCTV